MPRSLATTRYTARQAEQAFLASTGQYAVRFDVLDRSGALQPIQLVQAAQSPQYATTGGVIDCVVDFDSTRQVRKTLTLKMFAQPAMQGQYGRLWIRPWLQMRMPDGGFAEYVMGTYLWMKPKRTIDAVGSIINSEMWDVTLGDRQQVLDFQGPGPAGIQLAQGMTTTAAVAQLIALAGSTDLSQVQPAASALADTLSFTLSSGDQSVHVYDPTTVYFMEVAYYNQVVYNNLVTALGHPELVTQVSGPSNPVVKRLGNSPETIAKILDTLHNSIGYAPGYYDLEDRWVARAQVNPSSLVGAQAGITYTAEAIVAPGTTAAPGSRVNLMLGTPDTTPDATLVGNRVAARSQSTANSDTPVAFADLNTIMPLHPLAQQNIGFYIDHTVDDPAAAAADLPNVAITTLLQRALEYETMTLETAMYPAHEGYELVGVIVPNDSEFSPPGVVGLETAWKGDLCKGRMTHTIKRAY